LPSDTNRISDLVGQDDYEMVLVLVAKAKCDQIREYEATYGSWKHPRPKNCD